MENRPLTVVKIGGKPTQNELIRRLLFKDMAALESHRFILVHGGGRCVSDISRRYGIEPVFVNGIRQTTIKEMEIIDMGLAGTMNSTLLRSALAAGISAVGLSGIDSGLFTGKPLSKSNRTGKVDRVRPELVQLLLDNGYLPVVSSVSSDKAGMGVNINADDAAIALTTALEARQLIFISDIPGVLKDGNLIERLDGRDIREMISDGTINGGMIPKVNNALAALERGCLEVIIGTLDERQSLEDLMLHKSGSSIVLDKR